MSSSSDGSGISASAKAELHAHIDNLTGPPQDDREFLLDLVKTLMNGGRVDLPTSEQVQRMLRRPPTYTIDEIDRAPDPTQLIPAQTGSGSKPTPGSQGARKQQSPPWRRQGPK